MVYDCFFQIIKTVQDYIKIGNKYGDMLDSICDVLKPP